MHALPSPDAPAIVSDDGSGRHSYSIVAVGPQGIRSSPSPAVEASGLATLTWDSAAGADAYLVLRDNQVISGPLRIEGSKKQWTDSARPN
jgi:hypothetical protein